MVALFVDADACPVKEEIVDVAHRHNLTVYMVSNSWMRLPDSPLVKRQVVPEGPDIADDWIVDEISANDIVITGDIPLADRCIKKNAIALDSKGKQFTTQSIGMALAMRDLNNQLREQGVMTGGGAAFSRQHRSRFLSELENTIVRAVKNSRN